MRVGITENVLLVGANINDKGTLVLDFSVKGGIVSAADDFLNKVAEVKNENVSSLMVFPPSVEYLGEKREVKQIANSLKGFRDQLQHFLLGYLTSDKAVLDPYAGIDTTDQDAFVTALGQQVTVDKIYKNLATQFIAKVDEIGAARLNSEAFRLLLIRQSITKHFGTLRSNFISQNPFWESMSVPRANSSVRFTKYEVTKGLDSGTPVAQTNADATTSAPATGQSAADLILGQR